MRHALSDVDPVAQTATCEKCGPVATVIKQGRPACQVARSSTTRKSLHKMRYGIGPEDYALLLSVQDGLCAICKTPETVERPLQVDHSHTTGRVRGLLCFSCNVGLGQFGDDLAVMRAALDYLEMYDR